MRILLVSFVENNLWTGMGKWSHRMADALSHLGHAPTLWFADDFPMIKRSGRLSVLLFPALLPLRIWRNRTQFDAVGIHEPSGYWYGVLRRLFPFLPPMIAICHNVESKHFGEMLRAASVGLATVSSWTRIKTPVLRLWQSDGAIKAADHVTCLSTVDADYVTGHLGCPKSRVTRLTNGVAQDYFVERAKGPHGRRVVYVGGWLDVKGRRLLPSLWSQVRARHPDAALTAIGTGQAAESVLAQFEPPDRASVRVIPNLPSEAAMINELAAHDVFLMPSLSEGCPLALLEAMAAQLPVVATSVGGIPDVVTHGVTGLLFPSMDSAAGTAAVCRLLDDQDLADRLARAGQDLVRNMTWVAAARTLAAALDAGPSGAPEENEINQLSSDMRL